MEKLKFEISKAIEGKFEVVNTKLPCLESRIGLIDFRKISLEQAERLVEVGTRYLRRIDEVPKIEVPEITKTKRNRVEK